MLFLDGGVVLSGVAMVCALLRLVNRNLGQPTMEVLGLLWQPGYVICLDSRCGGKQPSSTTVLCRVWTIMSAMHVFVTR